MQIYAILELPDHKLYTTYKAKHLNSELVFDRLYDNLGLTGYKEFTSYNDFIESMYFEIDREITLEKFKQMITGNYKLFSYDYNKKNKRVGSLLTAKCYNQWLKQYDLKESKYSN